LVGTWQVTTGIDRVTYVFSDSGSYDKNRFVFVGSITENTSGVFRARSDTIPKWVDLVQTLSPTGTVDLFLRHGVFERRLDTLVVALTNVSDPRPTGFTPAAGVQILSLVKQP
jgi:hypothetical protein